MNTDTKIKLLEKLASELIEVAIYDDEIEWKQYISQTKDTWTFDRLERSLNGYFLDTNDIFYQYEEILGIDNIFDLVSQDLRGLQYKAIENILSEAEKLRIK